MSVRRGMDDDFDPRELFSSVEEGAYLSEEAKAFLDSLPDASGTFEGSLEPAHSAGELRDAAAGIRARQDSHCPCCSGMRTLQRSWVFSREPECDCGMAGGQFAFHLGECDSVPCPFCQLVEE